MLIITPMFIHIFCWIPITLSAFSIRATPETCSAFERFVKKFQPEQVPEWVRDNCDKIQPRPQNMTCDDLLKFAADCGLGSPSNMVKWPSSKPQTEELIEQITTTNHEALPATVLQAEILPRYIHENRRTAYDYGKYGNWYYPNHYPSTYINNFGTPADSAFQHQNEWKWTEGGDYPHHRADNIVNIALQQTIVPTCLHDLLFCIRQLVVAHHYGQTQRYAQGDHYASLNNQ